MASTGPSPSPVPRREGAATELKPDIVLDSQAGESATVTTVATSNTPALPSPTLRLHIQDLRHPAASAFLRLVPDITAVLETALANIVQQLYTPPRRSNPSNTPPTSTNISTTHRPLPTFTPSVPPTRSVTVILRDFSGVAYTTGTELDDDHKEIHFSLSYIKTSTTYPDPRKELAGVLTHELVHCYQHTTPPDARDQDKDQLRPPGGLIEGIADFVRLKAGLDPPHWKRPTSAKDRPEKWDQGYQHTAFFLAWLEDVRVGTGAIGLLNDRLFRVGYVGEGGKDAEDTQNGFWKSLFGAGIADLWDEYGQYLDGSGSKSEGGKGSSVRASGNWEEEIVNPE